MNCDSFLMSNIEADQRGLIVRCPSCGQRNRMVYERLGGPFRCSKCRQELPPPAEPIDICSDVAFDALVGRSPLPVLVDFWAPWCGPCKMVAPEIAKVASRKAGQLLVVKVNTDEVAGVGDRLGIRSIPTMAVFKGGREIARTAGARPASDIEAFVANALR